MDNPICSNCLAALLPALPGWSAPTARTTSAVKVSDLVAAVRRSKHDWAAMLVTPDHAVVAIQHGFDTEEDAWTAARHARQVARSRA